MDDARVAESLRLLLAPPDRIVAAVKRLPEELDLVADETAGGEVPKDPPEPGYDTDFGGSGDLGGGLGPIETDLDGDHWD